MRKQTKLVAVLSAAALLAIGASMTSMAATRGWTQEDGEWIYLNSDGEKATETWKRSGDYYYWFDENGDMAKGRIINSNDNFYYVNEDGVRLTNQWVAVENEDGDTVDGKEVDVFWYYLGTTGRAYKSDDPDMLRTSLIDGKRYFFDENARMVSGWTTTTDNGGKESTYYLGDENQGWALCSQWQFLEIPEEIQGEYDVDEAWFRFGSSGKVEKSKRTYIDGAYYAFDDNGVMLDDWQSASPSASTVSTPSNIKLGTNGKAFYNLETGNQGTGWVHTWKEDDEGGDEKWFYMESSKYNQVFNYNGKDSWYQEEDENKNKVWNYGVIEKHVSGQQDGSDPVSHVAAKVIKGKTYLFDSDGVMLSGVYEFKNAVACNGGKKLQAGIYYFNKKGGSIEGRMEKGRTPIDYDGETFTYYFTKDGKACQNELNDGAVYDFNGVRVEARDGNANQTYNISEITGGNGSLKLGDYKYTEGTIIVSSTGKIRTGSVVIEDVRYEIKNYVVVSAYDKYDKDPATRTDLKGDRYVEAELATE